MNCIWNFVDLEEQRQMHCESPCQKGMKTGRYKGRQILEFKVSLGQSEVRPRPGGHGDLRARPHPANLFFVFTKAGRSLSSFLRLREK